MARFLDRVALFCVGSLVLFQVSCAEESSRLVGPKVLFKVTVPPDPLEETYLDPIVLIQDNKFQSPSPFSSFFPLFKKEFLTQDKSYTLFQNGSVRGTVHPHRFIMQECNGEELVTGKSQFSTASYERDYESKEASFLASNQVVSVSKSLEVTEKDTQALLALGRQHYKQAGFPPSAVERLKVSSVQKRDLLDNQSPFLVASLELPFSEKQGVDDVFGAMLIIAHHQGLELIEDLATSAKETELYQFVGVDDIDGDGAGELIMQKMPYYSDAGYEYQIMKWAQDKWTVIYTGGGSGGC